jgi:hypothetical protein
MQEVAVLAVLVIVGVPPAMVEATVLPSAVPAASRVGLVLALLIFVVVVVVVVPLVSVEDELPLPVGKKAPAQDEPNAPPDASLSA